MKRLLLSLGLALLCSACGEERSPAESSPDLVRPEAEVTQMRLVAGRWKSQPGVLPGQDRRHVIMDIANDGSVSMELRERGPKMDIVLAESRGQVDLSDGAISGSLEDAGRELRYFRSFTADMPEGGVIMLKGNGAGIEMAYAGQ